MKDFAIYTAIVGEYDNILQPLVVDERFDYILFSNDVKENIGVWQVRPIPYHNDIQTKIARWVKTHPEELLPEYNYTIWMDANIQINSSFIYSKCVEISKAGVLIGSMKHPKRDCVYDEAVEVLSIGLDHEYNIIKWIKFLRESHFPAHFGLFETGILFRSHGNDNVKLFDETWWNCIHRYSYRDQLSFSYSLYMAKLNCFCLSHEDIRSSSQFNYIHHDSPSKIAISNKKEDPLIQFFKKKHPQYTKEDLMQLYNKIVSCREPLFIFSLYSHYYRIVSHFRK